MMDRAAVYVDYTSFVEALKQNDSISLSAFNAEMVFINDLISLDKKILSMYRSSKKMFKTAFTEAYNANVSLDDYISYLRTEIDYFKKRYDKLKNILRKYK